MFNQILFSFIFVWLYMTLVYFIAIKKDDLSIIDIAYGPGFVVAGFAQMIFSKGVQLHFLIIFSLILIWAIRLALQIGIRKIGIGEDYRYSKMRKDFGKKWKTVSYFKIFLFQGLLILIIELPLFISSLEYQKEMGILALFGVLLWVWGFFWETLGDTQKYQFKKAGKKGFIQTGLWKYTRHPNYYGEITMWWALFLIALEIPFGWLAIISPILITTLLITFSGIPLLEKKYDNDSEFQKYKKKTSALFPWFQKKGD